MLGEFDRRTILKGATGIGLAASGAAALLESACKPATPSGLPVNVLTSQGSVTLTIQQLMVEKGYLQQFGVVPTTLSVKSGTNIIGPLLNGQADICVFAGFSQLLVAIEKGADLKIVAGASVKGQQALFAKNPAIQHVKDLEGRTVGVGAIGAQLHQVTLALLKKKGVDVSKVQFINIGTSGDVFRAVAAGTVDAGNGEADVRSSLDRLGVHMVQDGDYAVELPEYTWQASFTATPTIKAKREQLVRTLAAYCKAYRYIQSPSSKDDFIKAQLDALQAKNNDRAVAAATSQWDYLQSRKTYAEDLALSPERVQYMQELNVQLGNQKKVLPYDRIVDVSIAEEAVKRLA